MDAFRANFPELFGRIIGYLHPIDLIALSLVSHQYADCYPSGFSLWRYNTTSINSFISSIIHMITPPMNADIGFDSNFLVPIHAGNSLVQYNDKHILYSYTGDYKQTTMQCLSLHKGYDINFEIPDNGKIRVEYKYKRQRDNGCVQDQFSGTFWSYYRLFASD